MLILIPLLIIVAALIFYTVHQQHAAVIERLGCFHTIVGPGMHARIPFVDVVRNVSLMTQDEHVQLNAKTADNVTITLDVSVQYHVDDSDMDSGEESGIYKSVYTLSDPVAQMHDYLADALRSQVPSLTLDEVFSEKDTIAQNIDKTLGEKMKTYGYTVETALITDIKLPDEVQESMNHIVASKNNLESATNDANAARAKTVIAAEAKAAAMKAEGQGIADQRVAIARGIRDSLDTIKGAELDAAEANQLFAYTQWVDMMSKFAERGGTSTLVLPSDFKGTVLGDMMAAKQTDAPTDGKTTGQD